MLRPCKTIVDVYSRISLNFKTDQTGSKGYKNGSQIIGLCQKLYGTMKQLPEVQYVRYV